MEELPQHDAPEPVPTVELTAEEAAGIQARFLTQVYSWMAAALAITGAVALYTAASPLMHALIFGTRFTFLALLLLQLGLVWWLSRNAFSLAPDKVVTIFLGYAAVSGLTFSVLFLTYTAESIASTFFVTAGMFGVMSVYGLTTRRDLSGWGSFLLMAVVGLILASVVNWFLNSPVLYWVTSIIGVLVFVGLTAYDTQKVSQMAFLSVLNAEDETEAHAIDRRASVLGALVLYLDFVNLFLYLLRLLGRRK